MKRILIALVTLCAVPVAAQAPAATNTAANSVRPLFAQGAAWVLAAAEQMPETDYGFKPTPEIRSFGQLVGHVANAQFMLCSAALGQSSPNQQNWEQVTEKAALIEALRASTAYCNGAYDVGDEAAAQEVNLFGQQMTRLRVLAMNAAHDFEHYGNIVTYMRLKGMTPPSSQGN